MPSHHGHGTSDRVPPRLEMTVPVPRQGGQGAGSPAGSAALDVLTSAGR